MILASPSGEGTGLNQYGFEVPQGNPGALEAAGRACSRWGAALTSRATKVRSAATSAAGAWSGTAERGFAGYAGHLAGVYDSLAGVVDNAARAVSTFAQELDTAQRVTNQALQECETYQREATTAQQDAANHSQTVQNLTTQAAAAVHPQQQADLQRQLTTAQDQQAAAERTAGNAQDQLQDAQRRGTRAWTDYQHQAQATARALASLDSEIQQVQQLPGTGAPGAGPGTGKAQVPGLWPAFSGPAEEDASDAAIGFAEGLLRRYRSSDLALPITKQAGKTLQGLSPALRDDDPFAQLPDGLWVPKSSDANPLVQRLNSLDSSDGFSTPGKGFFVPGEDDLGGAAPGLTQAAGRALGVAGAGLTLYSTAADQWNEDTTDHPGWSTTHKVVDTTQKTVVVGGSTVAGALGGAEVGAEGGAAAGAAVGSVVPIVGTAAGGVIGGVVGGIGGGLIGGGVGHTVGQGLESVGHGAGHVISHVWNSVF